MLGTPAAMKALASLINLVGLLTGVALYAMLLAMVLRLAARRSPGRGQDRLALATALLGLAWNVGALSLLALRELGGGAVTPVATALAFSALGFLPALVVHAALRRGRDVTTGTAAFVRIAAYALSATAGVLQFHSASIRHEAPSGIALTILAAGFAVLVPALFAAAPPEARGRRGAVWAIALVAFCVSAIHLERHEVGGDTWSGAIFGHHASLPLALAILFEDYRFALADVFLKRALGLLLVVGCVFGLYLGAVAPLLVFPDAASRPDPRAIGVLLGLWVGTALLYPFLRRGVDAFVDAFVLRRPDYGVLKLELARAIAALNSPEEVFDEVCRLLAPALSARRVDWCDTHRALLGSGEPGPGQPLVVTGSWSPLGRALPPAPDPLSATVLVPTTDPPQYALLVGPLTGGRRLLSDDVALLESVAVLAARRLDAMRLVHERCERSVREQEMARLATEAELKTLRAQLNPHFLFNALTTIGYLLRAAPERALDTLMQLTTLLRGVLKRSEGEFATLGQELDLVSAYLAIERERFEERLEVAIQVPAGLRSCLIPSLVVQPLVENAIKHGIAPSKAGGRLVVEAVTMRGADGEELEIRVADTGVGVNDVQLQAGRRRGVGLANIEKRLALYYGAAGALRFSSIPGAGSTVEVRLPLVPREAIALDAQAGGGRAAQSL
jgi:signal transduction histidine kinase